MPQPPAQPHFGTMPTVHAKLDFEPSSFDFSTPWYPESDFPLGLSASVPYPVTTEGTPYYQYFPPPPFDTSNITDVGSLGDGIQYLDGSELEFVNQYPNNYY
jgi:hypothetical protein